MFRRRPYNLVISDLIHPGLNGSELISKIRKAEAVAPCAPLHGISNPDSRKAMRPPGSGCQQNRIYCSLAFSVLAYCGTGCRGGWLFFQACEPTHRLSMPARLTALPEPARSGLRR